MHFFLYLLGLTNKKFLLECSLFTSTPPHLNPLPFWGAFSGAPTQPRCSICPTQPSFLTGRSQYTVKESRCPSFPTFRDLLGWSCRQVRHYWLEFVTKKSVNRGLYALYMAEAADNSLGVLYGEKLSIKLQIGTMKCFSLKGNNGPFGKHEDATVCNSLS